MNETRAMMTIDQVLALVPVSRTTLYRMEREGNFPRGIYLSQNRKIWFADEVLAWQRALPGKAYVSPPRKVKLAETGKTGTITGTGSRD